MLWAWANHFTLVASLTRAIFSTLLGAMLQSKVPVSCVRDGLVAHPNKAKWWWWFPDGSSNNDRSFDHGDWLWRSTIQKLVIIIINFEATIAWALCSRHMHNYCETTLKLCHTSDWSTHVVIPEQSFIGLAVLARTNSHCSSRYQLQHPQGYLHCTYGAATGNAQVVWGYSQAMAYSWSTYPCSNFWAVVHGLRGSCNKQ